MMKKPEESAHYLKAVPLSSALLYSEKREHLVTCVNEKMFNNPDTSRLIDGDFSMMRDNHKNHALFMENIFFINNFELMAKVVVWVYRMYSAHGFHYDYFPLVLNTWMEAIKALIPPEESLPLLEVYQWMIDNHKNLMERSKNKNLEELADTMGATGKAVEELLVSLIAGDQRKCLEIANQSIRTSDDIESFYLSIIYPALKKIGDLWETNKISIAREHMASSIIIRIMASIDANKTEMNTNKGKVLITTSPGELHEIGAWMLSDMLELKGWDVNYIGANVPEKDLLRQLEEFSPQVLAISITMPFNITRTADLIKNIRNRDCFKNLKILVGGLKFFSMENFHENVGADAYSSDINEAADIIERIYLD